MQRAVQLQRAVAVASAPSLPAHVPQPSPSTKQLPTHAAACCCCCTALTSSHCTALTSSQVDFGEDVCIFGEKFVVGLTEEIEKVAAAPCSRTPGRSIASQQCSVSHAPSACMWRAPARGRWLWLVRAAGAWGVMLTALPPCVHTLVRRPRRSGDEARRRRRQGSSSSSVASMLWRGPSRVNAAATAAYCLLRRHATARRGGAGCDLHLYVQQVSLAPVVAEWQCGVFGMRGVN